MIRFPGFLFILIAVMAAPTCPAQSYEAFTSGQSVQASISKDHGLRATETGYIKRRTIKRTPEEQKAWEEAQKNKPKPKKKVRKRRPGASDPRAPMDVSPPITPPPPHGPVLVPQYDRRPDTFPDD